MLTMAENDISSLPKLVLNKLATGLMQAEISGKIVSVELSKVFKILRVFVQILQLFCGALFGVCL